MYVAVSTATSWEGCLGSPPTHQPTFSGSGIGERDEVCVEEEHASAPEEADGRRPRAGGTDC